KARPHANADHDETGIESTTALERHAATVNRGDTVLEMEIDTVLLVQRANEVAELCSEHALKRAFLGRHHMNFYIPGAQRTRNFKSDEARADHERTLGRFCLVNNRAAVDKRAQGMHVRLIGAGNG